MDNSDLFILCLNTAALLAQGILQYGFCTRLLGRPRRAWLQLCWLAVLFLADYAAGRLGFVLLSSVVLQLLLVYGLARLGLAAKPRRAALAAGLAVCILQLSFGILDSAQTFLLLIGVGGPLVYPAAVVAMGASFVLCAACYAAVPRLLDLSAEARTAEILPLPLLFFLAAELYVRQTAYTRLVYRSDPAFLRAQAGLHTALLCLQALGLAALFCTLYACRAVRCGFESEAALRSLHQAAAAQKSYLAEAAARDARTRAFRHDIQNHLTVLDGLLQNETPQAARAYLQKLGAVSAGLARPWHTGSPVADLLLGEKLGLAAAQGVTAEVSLALPSAWCVDELDLCIILANALDNALFACKQTEGEKRIRITGKRQGGFYHISVGNTCLSGPLPPMGTGLCSIRAAAEKYHGSMLTEKAGGCFRLDVLLNISLPPKDGSCPRP